MASSRKRPPKPDPVEQRLLDALREAVAACLAGTADGALPERPAPGAPLLIAYSGGRDSVALLDAACRLRRSRARGFAQIVAVHVHHGLLPDADQWTASCGQVCARLEVALQIKRVEVAPAGRGIEEAARSARYAALADAAAEHGAAAVLTAHHLDDRIETFLMQWMRGAGIDGLTGFVAARAFTGGAALLRPWLALPRADIEHYVAQRTLDYVDDPSNAEPRLLQTWRNRAALLCVDQTRSIATKACIAFWCAYLRMSAPDQPSIMQTPFWQRLTALRTFLGAA